jgi:hypothetical protein
VGFYSWLAKVDLSDDAAERGFMVRTRTWMSWETILQQFLKAVKISQTACV